MNTPLKITPSLCFSIFSLVAVMGSLCFVVYNGERQMARRVEAANIHSQTAAVIAESKKIEATTRELNSKTLALAKANQELRFSK